TGVAAAGSGGAARRRAGGEGGRVRARGGGGDGGRRPGGAGEQRRHEEGQLRVEIGSPAERTQVGGSVDVREGGQHGRAGRVREQRGEDAGGAPRDAGQDGRKVPAHAEQVDAPVRRRSEHGGGGAKPSEGRPQVTGL